MTDAQSITVSLRLDAGLVATVDAFVVGRSWSRNQGFRWLMERGLAAEGVAVCSQPDIAQSVARPDPRAAQIAALREQLGHAPKVSVLVPVHPGLMPTAPSTEGPWQIIRGRQVWVGPVDADGQPIGDGA